MTTAAARPLPVPTARSPRVRVLGQPSPEALARAIRVLADAWRARQAAQTKEAANGNP